MMRARLEQLDRRLMECSLRTRSPARDRLLIGVTRAASYSRLWLLIAGLIAAGGGRRGRRAAADGMVSIAIAATVVNGPAKLLARRDRPAPSLPSLIAMPATTSFPSGHSASAFAFATGVCMDLPRLAPLLVPLAGAVAYSRVHTGVHHPSDVLAGASFGIAAGATGGRLARLVGAGLPQRRGTSSAAPSDGANTHPSRFTKSLCARSDS